MAVRQNENPARTGEGRGSREPSLAPSGQARGAPASCLNALAYTHLTAVGTRSRLSTGVLSEQQTAHSVRSNQTRGRLDHSSVGRNPHFAISVQSHHSGSRHHAGLICISRRRWSAALHFSCGCPRLLLDHRCDSLGDSQSDGSTGEIVVRNAGCPCRERPVTRSLHDPVVGKAPLQLRG